MSTGLVSRRVLAELILSSDVHLFVASGFMCMVFSFQEDFMATMLLKNLLNTAIHPQRACKKETYEARLRTDFLNDISLPDAVFVLIFT